MTAGFGWINWNGGLFPWFGIRAYVLLAFAIGPSFAQSDSDAQRLSLMETQSMIDERKRDLERAIGEATFELRKTYLEQLANLEIQAVSERNYEAAAQIRDRRKSLEVELNRFDPAKRALREQQAIECQMKDATRSTGVVLARDGTLGRWKSVDSSATWELRSVKPGEYRVEVTYSCAKKIVADEDNEGRGKAGGLFTLSEVSEVTSDRNESLIHRVEPTESWEDDHVERLGVVRLNGQTTRLVLTCLEVEAEGLMQLKRLRLIPLELPEDESPRVNSNLPMAETFKASYERMIREKTAVVNRAYLTSLEELRERAKTASDQELIEDLEEELSRVRRELEGLSP